MILRFWKWLIVVLVAAALVVAIRHSLSEADGPEFGSHPPPVATQRHA